MSQYIGRTISLVSSKGIRYNGILREINGEESTVTLENVKPLGTEGRLGDPKLEIPPSNEVYPVVVFKGSDVIDLSVLEDPTPAPSATTPSAITTTTEPEASKPKESEKKEEEEEEESDDEEVIQRPRRHNQSQTTYKAAETPRHREHLQHHQHQHQHQQQQQQQPQQQQQRYNQGRPQRPDTFSGDVPDTEFNFEENNAKLEQQKHKVGTSETSNDENDQDGEGEEKKDTVEKDLAKEFENIEIGKYDKKSSFFDTISSSTTIVRPPNPNDNNNNNNRGRGGHRGRGRGRGNANGNWRGRSNDWNNSWRGGYKSQFADEQ